MNAEVAQHNAESSSVAELLVIWTRKLQVAQALLAPEIGERGIEEVVDVGERAEIARCLGIGCGAFEPVHRRIGVRLSVVDASGAELQRGADAEGGCSVGREIRQQREAVRTRFQRILVATHQLEHGSLLAEKSSLKDGVVGVDGDARRLERLERALIGCEPLAHVTQGLADANHLRRIEILERGRGGERTVVQLRGHDVAKPAAARSPA